MRIKKHQKTKRRLAFTLIEILVVVSILAILTALLVPRLRTVTKERNIREASRIVGSMFSRASQRAASDGICGVILQRNSNFAVSGTSGFPTAGYPYAATRLAMLRRVPDFNGDQISDRASGDPDPNNPAEFAVTIPRPLEQDSLEIVQAGDSISFGTSSLSYQIESVATATDPTKLRLVLDGGVNSYLPNPSDFDMDSRRYTIERLPRLLKSTITDLPDGHLIDLRFSGCQTNDSGYRVVEDAPRGGLPGLQLPINIIEPNPRVRLPSSVLIPFGPSPVPPPVLPANPGEVVILFDDQGKFDRMVMKSLPIGGTTFAYTVTPQSPFYAFVTRAASNDNADINGANPPENPLADEDHLWVSVSNATGIVNVGYNNPSGVPGIEPQNFSMLGMSNLFSSDAPNDRAQFNNVISAARSSALVGSAAQ